jgi:tRNA(Ile)-lysidine synthase TilS/MesJ
MQTKRERVKPLMEKIRSKLPPEAKCTRCRGQAFIPLPSHHSKFCPDCFVHFFQTAVRRAMKKFLFPGQISLLVAVSGGKDSLAVWDVLHDLGYVTKGIHIHLGIDGFSETSVAAVDRFARQRDLPWVQYSLKEMLGYTMPEIRRRTRRKICSVCGTFKRQLLNRLTVRERFQALVTGHNLDDEAGRLLGNLVRHRDQYLEKQYPFLPSTHPHLPAKLKPLYRLEAHEIRTYCEVKGVLPAEGKCPLSRGATSPIFKEALNFLEEKMPGTKRDFLFSYVDHKDPPKEELLFGRCRQCGEVTYEDLCSVCNLLNQLRKNGREKKS